ncbi:MAG: MOSC domain-containing protein [Acidobacteriia bacterium]|nr:MOSC domain-containing protein [Terriglobia bacterium]
MARRLSRPDERGDPPAVRTGARVVSVNVSDTKGTRKHPVGRAVLVAGFGVEGDAHGGEWERQVSLLARESVAKMPASGLDLAPGDFGENVTTAGIDLASLPVGSTLRLGAEAEIRVTQIGKECHLGCEIRRQVGDCVMPREGIFARVTKAGTIAAGDPIEVPAVRKDP